MKTLFEAYTVTWRFLNELCGSVPQKPDLIATWLQSRIPASKPAEAKELSEIAEEVFESLANPTEGKQVGVTGFQRETPGRMGIKENLCNGLGGKCESGEGIMETAGSGPLVVRGATIRAHIKDCARQLSRYVVGKIKGESSFAVRVMNTVYVQDEWVPILKHGQSVNDPDGWIEKPFTAMTPRGPISAFKRFAYVTQPTLTFTLLVTGGAVKEADLLNLFQYGGVHGYAGERGMGYGRYIVEKLDRVEG